MPAASPTGPVLVVAQTDLWLCGYEACMCSTHDANARIIVLRSMFRALFRYPQNSKFFHFLSITSIFNHFHGALNVGKKKLIVQFSWKSRDESFELSWSTIEQYLPNKTKMVLVIRFTFFAK